MAHAERDEELLSTVAMFEEIVRAQPDDYQSLEILREAYAKLGRSHDVVRVSRDLASAHHRAGQISSAILEYEEVLRRSPDDADACAALARIEQETARKASHSAQKVSGFSVDDLWRSSHTGDEILGKVLLDAGLIRERVYSEGIETIQQWVLSYGQGEPRLSLPQYLEESKAVTRDELLSFLVRATRLPYIPIAACDIDRGTATLLMPRETAFSQVAILFDVVGRSPLVAIANPFDDAGRGAICATVGERAEFFIAAAPDIVARLADVYAVARVQPEARVAEV